MNASSPVSREALECHNSRSAAINDHPSVFADIYQENINIAIWKRDLAFDIKNNVDTFLKLHSNYRANLIVKPDTVFNKLIESKSELINAQALCKDISELVELFCVLFDLQQVGLRLTVLDRAMCPRFHVDRVPSRLVCTYNGAASEWLPHNKIDRSKLGRGNNGLNDDKSGLYQSVNDINKLNIGDVALLKGESWQGNESAGLVH
ncbi:MAG: DUF1826 domain-containing protein [Gammaproteobacteria bacterium]